MRYKHNCLSVSLLGRRSSDIVKDLNASNDTLDRIKDRAAAAGFQFAKARLPKKYWKGGI